MKVVVAGIGAIGGWMAALLAESGADVSLLARGATLAGLNAKGLRIRRRGGEEKVFRLRAGDDPATLGKPDYIVIATKGHDIPALAPALAEMLGPDTALVPAINGIPWWFFQVPGVPLSGTALQSVDPGGAVARAIPARHVIGCVVHASAWSPEPGVVEVQGEDKLIFGEPDGAARARTGRFAAAIPKARIEAAMSENIRLNIWTKLWGNMTMNPLSVLTGATTDVMLADGDVRALIRAMMEEMKALGAQIGLPLSLSPDERMAITRRLGPIKTSMLRDWEAHRPLEVGPILGALVEIADRLKAPAPNLRAVLGLLRLRVAAR